MSWTNKFGFRAIVDLSFVNHLGRITSCQRQPSVHTFTCEISILSLVVKCPYFDLSWNVHIWLMVKCQYLHLWWNLHTFTYGEVSILFTCGEMSIHLLTIAYYFTYNFSQDKSAIVLLQNSHDITSDSVQTCIIKKQAQFPQISTKRACALR